MFLFQRKRHYRRGFPACAGSAFLTALLAGVLGAGLLTASSPSALAVADRAGDPVLAWGQNFYGQLGNGTTTGSSLPTTVSLPAGAQIKAVTGGFDFSLALTTTGQVWAWGANSSGQLGNGTTIGSTVPVEVHLPLGTTVTAVAAGSADSLAVTSTGQVLAWGDNFAGQLGNGTTASSSVPVEVRLPQGVTATAIAAGGDHNLAVTSTGQVFAWGQNYGAQLGDSTATSRIVPVRVHLPAGTKVTAVAAGAYHSLALTSTGQVLAWGYNSFGQLGDGTTIQRTVPFPVHLPAGVTVTAITSGSGGYSYSNLALTSTGQVLAWGANSSGQLGDGTTTSSYVPVYVSLPVGTAVTAIAAGAGVFADGHGLALTSTGRVLSWGSNIYGQLGDGTNVSSDVPVAVSLPGGATATAIGAGSGHSMAVVTVLS